jgi:hypothetical protein
MSFYIRKYIKIGPFRFNLSKSGVGVSAGVKGLRLGTGPRGNYVHLGRYGLYYRATLPPSSAPPIISRPKSVPEPGIPPGSPRPEIPPGTHEPLQEIESADVSQMVDSSSTELLKELNHKRGKIRLWPAVATVTIVVPILGSFAGLQVWVIAALFAVGAIGVYCAYQRDLLAKTSVIFYDFDPEMEKAYADLHQSGEQLASCAKAWHIEAQGQVRDRKYHAGASSLIRRKSTSVKKSEPPYVKTNIETIAIGLGRRVLHFFPDRILIYDTNGVGAVSYSDLQINTKQSRFVEDEGVPGDAKLVDYTWRYVNKKGGPDRRFKNNSQIPICLYDEISLTSSSGLNEIIQLSRIDIGEGFKKAVQALCDKLPANN